MANPPIEPNRSAQQQTWAWLAAAALLALRIPHLGGPLDDPHSWRQCDTAHYSLDFARRGLDLLHPAVCWLGGHRTLIFEFPLPEAVSALLQRTFGPGVVWDRLVGLACFGMATGYLFGFARGIAGSRVAWLTALAYLAFPLGQFYSRAAHVDFAATAFAHALLYHGARAFAGRSWPQAAAAGAAGALAALVKAPYLLPVLGPLAMAALGVGSAGATLALSALVLGVPALAFVVWRRHVDAVNAAAPDWSFLPGYYKEVNPGWWYYGRLGDRLQPASWIKLARRLIMEVLSPAGVPLALLGLARRGGAPGARGRGPLAYALAWGAGLLLYLAVFFPLNLIHDYYQIPFLAPAALLVALGGDWLWERLPRLGPVPAGVAAFALFLAVAAAFPLRLGYYRVDWLRVEAGRRIAARVPAGDLVVASDYASGYSDPRLLFRADREGWSLAVADLADERLARLRALGARWLAVVTDPAHPGLVPPAELEPWRVAREALVHGGVALGELSVYDLRLATGEAGPLADTLRSRAP